MFLVFYRYYICPFVSAKFSNVGGKMLIFRQFDKAGSFAKTFCNTYVLSLE